MLVAISGSQGTGKTTIINALSSMGYNTIERKTSRSLLDELDMTLDEINGSIVNTMRFQDLIIDRKYQDEFSASISNELWFTERSYADLFTYAALNIGRFNECSLWLDDYYDQCRTHQMSYYKVIYLTNGHFEVANDGVRSANKHYSDITNAAMYNITSTMSNNMVTIDVADINDRISEILHASAR